MQIGGQLGAGHPLLPKARPGQPDYLALEQLLGDLSSSHSVVSNNRLAPSAHNTEQWCQAGQHWPQQGSCVGRAQYDQRSGVLEGHIEATASAPQSQQALVGLLSPQAAATAGHATYCAISYASKVSSAGRAQDVHGQLPAQQQQQQHALLLPSDQPCLAANGADGMRGCAAALVDSDQIAAVCQKREETAGREQPSRRRIHRASKHAVATPPAHPGSHRAFGISDASRSTVSRSALLDLGVQDAFGMFLQLYKQQHAWCVHWLMHLV